MAACDNLHGNASQWEELHDFLSTHNPEYLKYMRPKPSTGDEAVRICYVADIQKWLLDNFHAEWVKEELEENFAVQRMIVGKAHHEK